MAVLRQGSVISATIEQSLGNCLLVYFKHRSRTFRGVLFDEKNSVVARTTISKQSHDNNLMVNKSSLPLGMAVVSPSKQPYSSLRNRIYFNTTTKRNGNSNSRASGSKQTEIKSTLQAPMKKDGSTCTVGSSHSMRKGDHDGENERDSRHRCRSLRQRSKTMSDHGHGLKRKADCEMTSNKPSKTRAHVLPSDTSSLVSCDNKNNDLKADQEKATASITKSKEIIIVVSSDSNNSNDSSESMDKTALTVGAESPNNKHGTESDPHISVRHNLFPPENTSKASNVFSNDLSETQGIINEENGNINEGSDEAAQFFGSLGLGSVGGVDTCRDDSSVFTDSGTSTSSSEHLCIRQEEKHDLNNESVVKSINAGNASKGEESTILTLQTPTKKSARISAKRAILEQNMENCDNETTIWSIWGGVPVQKQREIKQSTSSEETIHSNINSEETLSAFMNASPESISSSEFLTTADESNCTSQVRIKGARMKQTPVKGKKISSNISERPVSVGNIVWGKVHGHPWWPGRVLAVSGNIGEGSVTTQHAHVTWFGSNTSSIMPVNELQHFLANFSRRHKKTKRGCYRKAVKQAQDMLQIMGETI